MDPSRFDQLAQRLAQHRLTRRTALHAVPGALVATALAVPGERATTAAEAAATPAAAAAAPAAKGPTDAAYLFVQGYEQGTLAPKVGSADSFTLTLSGGFGHTVGFADRPKRSFGVLPTRRFLAQFPFGPKNPPNAALVMETGADQQAIAVVELTNPAYDAATHTATYDARVRADYQALGIDFQEVPKAAAAVPHQFGPTSVFIDDCPNGSADCDVGSNKVGSISIGCCWSWSNLGCQVCHSQSSLDAQCNSSVSACNGGCVAANACCHGCGIITGP